MTQILETILPIFLVIGLGFGLCRTKMLAAGVRDSMNQLVFYMAIPAMIFVQVSHADFSGSFSTGIVLAACLPIFAAFVFGLAIALVLRLANGARGSFIQTGFHGNLGYLGLAVAYYFLGDSGLAIAGIIAAFIMLFQNLLAVATLGFFGAYSGSRLTIGYFARKVLLNPVIIEACAGIAFSLSGAAMPTLVSRTLYIIADMALPLALLVIGASLNFSLLLKATGPILLAGAIKLFLMPAAGWILHSHLGLAQSLLAPLVILLAAPTATVTYVMSREMNGDPAFAAAAVSLVTLLSAPAYVFWLSILS